MRGVVLDEEGASAPLLDADAVVSFADFDKGALEVSAVDIVFFEDSAGLMFSLAISDEPVARGKSEAIGLVDGTETSLRRPGGPALCLFESSSWVISTGMDDCDADIAFDTVVPSPRLVDCVDDAIGRVVWGRCNDRSRISGATPNNNLARKEC